MFHSWLKKNFKKSDGFSVFGGINSSTYYADNDRYVFDTWTSRTSVLTARDYTSASSIGSFAYVVGGQEAGGEISDTDEYSYTVDAWKTLTDAPATSRYGAAQSNIDNKFYIFGGFDSATYYADTDEYTVSTDAWASKTNYSTAQYFSTAMELSSKAYLFGGLASGSSYRTNTDEYVVDSYTAKTANATDRASHAVGSIDDKAYIMAGYNSGSGNVQSCQEYVSDTWVGKTQNPTPGRSEHSASSMGGGVFITGGWNGSATIGDNDRYNKNGDVWTSETDLISPTRRGLSSAEVNLWGFFPEKILHMVGGWTGSARLADHDKYQNDTWTALGDITTARRNCTSYKIGNKLYIENGSDGGGNIKENVEYVEDFYTDRTPRTIFTEAHEGMELDGKGYVFCGSVGTPLRDTDEYTDTTDAWVAKSDIPTPGRYHANGGSINDVAYIFAGYGTAWLQDTDEYNPDTWTSKTSIPTPARAGCSVFTINDILYVAGGDSASSRIADNDQYDPDTWTAKTSLTATTSYPKGGASNGRGYNIAGIGASGLRVSDVEEYDAASDSWVSRTDTTTAIELHTVTAVGDFKGKFEARTFRNGGSTTWPTTDADHLEFLLSADVWSAKTDVTNGVFSGVGASAEDGDSLHIIRGYNSGEQYYNYKYKISTNSWSTETVIPASGGAAYPPGFTINGYIYCPKSNFDHYRLDPPGTWVSKTVMPAAVLYTQGFSVDYKGFVCGGYVSSILSDVNYYVENTWTADTDLVTGRYLCSTMVIDGNYGYIYGSQISGEDSSIEELINGTRKAMTSSTENYNRGPHNTGAGGVGIACSANTVTSHTETFDRYSDAWTAKTDHGELSQRCQGASIGNRQ